MGNFDKRTRHILITVWTLAILIFVYLPGFTIFLASMTSSRYFSFPITKWGLDWWRKTFDSLEVRQLIATSFTIAGAVTVLAVILGFLGALAFARYDWRGRKLYQKIVLLPIFFPQSVLGLALLLWFNALGLPLSWKTAVLAHLVWIAPVVTLVMAIQVYSFDPSLEEAASDLGASRWQTFREVTLPVLMPGVFSGSLFAFLLSWGNFPLSLYTTGADNTLPKYLYAKMVAGYTPGVPVLGTVSTIGAALVLLGGYAVMLVLTRKRDTVLVEQPAAPGVAEASFNHKQQH